MDEDALESEELNALEGLAVGRVLLALAGRRLERSLIEVAAAFRSFNVICRQSVPVDDWHQIDVPPR